MALYIFMIFDLKQQTFLRGYAFEILAIQILKKQNNNNFIFRPSMFWDFEELIKTYRLMTADLKSLSLIERYFKYI